MTALIEAHELSKWFGEVVAVNNLNLSIKPGITGLLGPNGAGKSTFIKLALGLYAPSRGSIKLFGEKPRNNIGVMRQVSYCPETDYFFENSTGYEFVFWLNRYWGMNRKKAHEAAYNALEMARMTERMHDAISSYSKGMRQRIKIAQALASAPKLLFLDEPMNGLDPRGREEMVMLIQSLADAGLSVIVSSHILYEIERITDNIVLIYRGNLLAQGQLSEIRRLIDQYPHSIRVTTGNPRGLSEPFTALPEVTGLEFENDAFTIHTRELNSCYELLNQMACEDASRIQGISCSDDNLQAIFDYLTR